MTVNEIDARLGILSLYFDFVAFEARPSQRETQKPISYFTIHSYERWVYLALSRVPEYVLSRAAS